MWRSIVLASIVLLPLRAWGGMFYFDMKTAEYPSSGAAIQRNTTTGNTPQTIIEFPNSNSVAYFKFWWPVDLATTNATPFTFVGLQYHTDNLTSSLKVCWRVSMAQQNSSIASSFDTLTYGTAAADSFGGSSGSGYPVNPSPLLNLATPIGPGGSVVAGTQNRPLFLKVERVKDASVCLTGGNDSISASVYLESFAIQY